MVILTSPQSQSDYVDILMVAILKGVLDFGGITGLDKLAKYDPDGVPENRTAADISSMLSAPALRMMGVLGFG